MPLLWLEPSCWRDLVLLAAEHTGLETGGVLLGWRYESGAVVTHVVGPGPHARHGLTEFHPDSAWQWAQVDELYEQSGRRLAYLGDWHTHPGGRPWPSRRDARTLRHIAQSAEARCPDPFMVILGSRARDDSADWEAGAFVLRGRSRWRPGRAGVSSTRLLLMPGDPDTG